MTNPSPICDVLADMIPKLDETLRYRTRVLRTSRTEDRAPIPRDLRIEVYMRDHFRCVWCGSDRRLELDHIKPWSAGGADTFDNLRTLCHDCNDHRSNYVSPFDDLCRRLPSVYGCARCCDGEFEGEEDAMVGVYCRYCRMGSVGIPTGDQWQPVWNEERAS